MLVEHHNSWTWVRDRTSSELEWLDDYLSVPTARYVAGVGYQEDRYRMLSQTGHRFASGLLPMAVRAGVAEGISIGMTDMRGEAPTQALGRDAAAWLRSYQHSAVDALVAAHRGVAKCPTGSGKGELIQALTRRLPVEWLLLCHRTDIVDMLADRYTLRTGERAGRFEKGRWAKGTCNLTVATFQGVFRALTARKRERGIVELLQAVKGLLIDEVHGQSASTYYRTTQAFDGAYYRFGFSGTPLHRGDVEALKLIGAIGEVAYSITYAELVEAGVLAKPTARLVRCEHQDHRGKWDDVYKGMIVRNAKRNQLVANMAERAQLPCLVFVDHLDHGKFLLPRLAAAGLRADFVHGKDKPDTRKLALRRLSEGDLDVLVCTVIFQEGIDVPSLRSVVVAGGKSSAVACLQRAGRGMRVAPGKETFELWDVADEGQEWLERHATGRAQTLRDEGIAVEVFDRM